MGQEFSAKCLDCSHAFSIQDGGGFAFHQLRCNTCAETKSVGFDDLGELHLRYVKGLGGPYCMASSANDAEIQGNPSIKPISEKEYHRKVRNFAGKCKCGGKFMFRAKPRCPKCRSGRIKKGDCTCCYD